MHTQYNLILSAATLLNSTNDENTLILYSEFMVTDEIRTSLSSVFDEVIIIRDNFEPLKKPIEETKYIRNCLKKVKSIRNKPFDCVYMSQERIFDRILLARAKKINPSLKCYNIEEDAYYSINEKLNADDYVHPDNFRRKRRRFLMRLLLAGHPYNYNEAGYCYGMSDEYDGAYLLFPHLARRELRGKELIEITNEELLYGINALYLNQKCEYPSSERYLLMFFDLIERYKNPELVISSAKKIIELYQKNGFSVLMKYHPRETQKITELNSVFELDKLIPAEKVLYDLYGKDVIVWGNSTTACVVAAKLGFSVFSVAKFENPENPRLHSVFSDMGINCIENENDILTFKEE